MNLAKYKRNYTPSGICSRCVRLVQHLEINQYESPYQHPKKKNHMTQKKQLTQKEHLLFSFLLAKTWPLVLPFVGNVFPCPHCSPGSWVLVRTLLVHSRKEIFSNPNPDCKAP